MDAFRREVTFHIIGDLRQRTHLPSQPGTAVRVAERDAEARLLVARQQRIMNSWQRQPSRVLH